MEEEFRFSDYPQSIKSVCGITGALCVFMMMLTMISIVHRHKPSWEMVANPVVVPEEAMIATDMAQEPLVTAVEEVAKKVEVIEKQKSEEIAITIPQVFPATTETTETTATTATQTYTNTWSEPVVTENYYEETWEEPVMTEVTEEAWQETTWEEEYQEETPAYNGSVLTAQSGINYGPEGKETYYNLPMGGVINIMRGIGNEDQYWVREDGVKMLGDYVMVAADLNLHPRGSTVETSLGTGIVCDTGTFTYANPTQIDIATAW